MAKYNSSPFGNISGEVLGVVASSNKGVKFLRNKGKVADAKTQKQLARRAIYGEFCTLWDEKILESSTVTGKDIFIKKELFREVLGFTLKFSPSASEMWLAVCPSDGTMSAPVFTKTGFQTSTNNTTRLTGFFLFPAFGDDGDFEFFSAYFGQFIYDYSSSKIVMGLYPQGKITSRELSLSMGTPNTTQNLLLGQKVFRSFWYVNKKTGQISKPVCIACDESGNVETFYPFGK